MMTMPTGYAPREILGNQWKWLCFDRDKEKLRTVGDKVSRTPATARAKGYSKTLTRTQRMKKEMLRKTRKPTLNEYKF